MITSVSIEEGRFEEDRLYLQEKVKDLQRQSAFDFNAQAKLVYIEAQLRQTEEALKQSRNGTSGRCKECGETIEDDRLGVLPNATSCSICAQRGSSPTGQARIIRTSMNAP